MSSFVPTIVASESDSIALAILALAWVDGFPTQVIGKVQCKQQDIALIGNKSLGSKVRIIPHVPEDCPADINSPFLIEVGENVSIKKLRGVINKYISFLITEDFDSLGVRLYGGNEVIAWQRRVRKALGEIRMPKQRLSRSDRRPHRRALAHIKRKYEKATHKGRKENRKEQRAGAEARFWLTETMLSTHLV